MRCCAFFQRLGGSGEQAAADGDMDAILRPIQRGILQLLGFDVLAPQIHYGPVRSSEEMRQRWLAEWEDRLLHICDELPIEVGTY